MGMASSVSVPKAGILRILQPLVSRLLRKGVAVFPWTFWKSNTFPPYTVDSVETIREHMLFRFSVFSAGGTVGHFPTGYWLLATGVSRVSGQWSTVLILSHPTVWLKSWPSAKLQRLWSYVYSENYVRNKSELNSRAWRGYSWFQTISYYFRFVWNFFQLSQTGILDTIYLTVDSHSFFPGQWWYHHVDYLPDKNWTRHCRSHIPIKRLTPWLVVFFILIFKPKNGMMIQIEFHSCGMGGSTTKIREKLAVSKIAWSSIFFFLGRSYHGYQLHTAPE